MVVLIRLRHITNNMVVSSHPYFVCLVTCVISSGSRKLNSIYAIDSWCTEKDPISKNVVSMNRPKVGLFSATAYYKENNSYFSLNVSSNSLQQAESLVSHTDFKVKAYNLVGVSALSFVSLTLITNLYLLIHINRKTK